MPKRIQVRTAVTLVVLAAIAIALAIGYAVAPDDKPAPPATITVPLDGLDAGKAPDRSIEVPAVAVQQAAAVVHDDLASESGATPEALAQEADIAATQKPLATAGATAGFAGCRTSFVGNQSSRRGVRPQVQTLHYTVSPNRPGWSDVNAITAFFDRSSSQASSHFIIDAEGNCAYIVPIEAKAWTQAAGNPTSVAYEIIATGRESRYLEPAGEAKLRAVAREVAKRTGIPLRRGAVSASCVVTRTGIVEHRDWGTCGGGHVDITPFSIEVAVESITAGQITATDRVTCRRLNAWRNAGRPHGGAWERNSVRRKGALTVRGVTCTRRGPVRA